MHLNPKRYCFSYTNSYPRKQTIKSKQLCKHGKVRNEYTIVYPVVFENKL